jgi:hypothetical protein
MENIVIEGDFEKTVIVESNYSPVQTVNGQVGFVNITPSGLGLGNVDNTRDLDKPISIATENRFVQLETGINNSFSQVNSYINGLSSTQSEIINNQDIKFRITLESGIEKKYINYPAVLLARPNTVHCEIENDIDEIIYMHKVSNISKSGFLVSFSDKLTNGGYILNTQLGK